MMKPSTTILSIGLIGLLASCREHHEEHHEEAHSILVTTPLVKDISTTEEYVAQIHSSRHIELCALESGYLEAVSIKEGQHVKAGDVLFQIYPVVFQAELAVEEAEAKVSELEYENTRKLAQQGVVSANEVALAKAKFDKAISHVDLARTRLNLTKIIAPFSGIIDRFHHQQGSLVEEGCALTTLSDNSTMWVYFNVPESRYLAYQANERADVDIKVELMLANHRKFGSEGRIAAIEADFNHETGNIAFRADFPNPDGVLRHGQTGTIQLIQPLRDAVIIPQRCAFEVLDKRYVFVIDNQGVVHQRRVRIFKEMEDILVIEDGLAAGDQVVYEGIRSVRDGEKAEFRTIAAEEVMKSLKCDAE